MEFRHLRYFLVLAEELHFGRAARRLSISQPPLSLNIQQLEASVGARLFTRNSKGVRLTAAGAAFVPRARALLEQAGEAARHARDVEQGLAGRLQVGFVGAMLYRGLPQMLREFQAQHPLLRLVLKELNSQDQLIELAHDQLDLGFVHTTRVPAEMSHLLFASEPLSVACPPTIRWRASARCRCGCCRASRLPWWHARCRPTTTSASWRSAPKPASSPRSATSCGTG